MQLSLKHSIILLISFALPSMVLAQTNNVNGSHQNTKQMTQQCSANGIDYQQAVTLVLKLQTTVKQNNKKAVAQLIAYPLRINTFANNKISHRYIKNKTVFLTQYNSIITHELKKRILALTPEDIFCNYQGAMISNGDIWFRSDNNTELKIFSINSH